MKLPVILRSLLAASALAALMPAYAAPGAIESRWGNIEGPWRFRIDPEDSGEGAGFARPDYDDSAWQLIEVPGPWEARADAMGAPSLSAYDGGAWYRLRLVIPPGWRDKALELGLGSVDDEDRA